MTESKILEEEYKAVFEGRNEPPYIVQIVNNIPTDDRMFSKS